MVYDGKVLSAYGKANNLFGRLPLEGTVEDAIERLRDDFELELPAADLLSSNPYDRMMDNITDAQVLDEGMIRGAMCDHLAFRTTDVDWQIWIAQGDKPFPCRFTITSKMTVLAPSYSIEFSGWAAGTDVPADNYQLNLASGAREVPMSALKGLNDVPDFESQGDRQ